MHRPTPSGFILAALVALSAAGLSACNHGNQPGQTAAASAGGKIPVTTTSEEARKEFLQGQSMADRLLGQESLQHFDQALALDPDFASAELARANNSPTAQEFFNHLRKAVSLAGQASNGEKLLILAAEAATNGDAAKQKQYLEQLAAAYPNDERAHFNLANYYAGQQDQSQAIEQYNKATALAPDFSGAYNSLGYAYRTQGDYADAEQAFKKYIELIPNDPNPYDSYAELLLKMGRFDDSMAQYRKALSIDPHFVPSHFGISADLMYTGKADAASAELQKMAAQARNDGELRTALFGLCVVAADRGKMEEALQQIDKEYAVAEKKSDVAAMAADLQAKGLITLETQKYDAAAQIFDRSVQMIEDSNQSQEIKDNAKLFHHFNLAAVAIARKDFASAKTHAEAFRKGAETSKNPALDKQRHELDGRLALAQKDYDQAIAELEQANQQDPRNLYRLAQAYEGKGGTAKAHDLYTQAAGFNPLPQLNYAFIRAKAQRLAAGKQG
jgi:tetratricopeptide (TPR) repeat protein